MRSRMTCFIGVARPTATAIASIALLFIGCTAAAQNRVFEGDDAAGDGKPNVSASADLWWFNGESPAGYSTKVTLTLNNPPAGRTFDWSIGTGADKVKFDGNTTQTTSVTVESIGASEAAQAVTKDVTINVCDHVTGKLICAFRMAVFAPDHALLMGDYTDRPSTHLAANTVGYASYCEYIVKDQFSQDLPANVAVNEGWPFPPEDHIVWPQFYQGWTIAPPNGLMMVNTVDSWVFNDQIGVLDPPAKHPMPVMPTDVGAGTDVDWWMGQWRVGSTTPGLGKPLTCPEWAASPQCKWHRYLGRARHE